MDTRLFTLRAALPELDFSQLAALFTLEQEEPTTEPGLMADYTAHRDRIIRLTVAEDGKGSVMGFIWVTRSRFDARQAYCYVIVDPERRRLGAGRLLYDDLEKAVRGAGVLKLRATVRLEPPDGRDFALRRGFSELSRHYVFELGLADFDDRRFHAVISKLRSQGFAFTSMQALGDNETAQRALYALNDATGMDEPGTDGTHSWSSFEDFRDRVCRADWYRPGGQIVAIDTASGSWAGMCAVTRFTGAGHAQVLHSGVGRPYRGRGLGQALKALALCHARDELGAGTVRTRHHGENRTAIAISRKMGFQQLGGTCEMTKLLG